MPSITNYNDSCAIDPNFAVICSFLKTYACILDIMNPTFKQLQEMVESKSDVDEDLVEIIVNLLRKSKLRVDDKKKWEQRLSKFCQTYSTDDAEEIIRLGFKNMKTSMKLRVIKELLEYQFVHNEQFKKIVNGMKPDDQRHKPLMEDNYGKLFWTLIDANDDAMVYEEDLRATSWNVLAHDRDELMNIIGLSKPDPIVRRTSERRSSGMTTYSIFEKKIRAKDLLKKFCVNIGRLREIS